MVWFHLRWGVEVAAGWGRGTKQDLTLSEIAKGD